MDLSSTLCRAQQAFHANRAAETRLENVRAVADKAAAAWGLEAVAAERREQRREKSRLFVGPPAEDNPALDAVWTSENPDRGNAETRIPPLT